MHATKTMMRLWLGVWIGLSAVMAAAGTQSMAEGFGAKAAGGHGGRVIEVSSLNDSGPGSLRQALSTRGPRIIRFTVEGRIELRSPLVVTEGRVTIDGGTAPGNGVTLLFRADEPFAVEPVSTQSAIDSYDLVLARAKAKVRDADDLRVIKDLQTRAGKVGGSAQRAE